MKRLAIVALLAVALSACGNKGETPTSDEPTATAASTPPIDGATAKPSAPPISPPTDARGQTDARGEIATLGETDARPDAPVRKATKCEDLERQVERAITAIDHTCTSDDDCEGAGFGCPFGCTIPIRKGANTRIAQKKADRYHELCGQCKYRCKRLDIHCVNKRCAAVEPDEPKKNGDNIIFGP